MPVFNLRHLTAKCYAVRVAPNNQTRAFWPLIQQLGRNNYPQVIEKALNMTHTACFMIYSDTEYFAAGPT